MDGPILVAGATGFVGRRLVPRLVAGGHEVHAMTRHPESYDGPARAVGGDVREPGTLAAPLSGARAAYYLVHSLADRDFERLDGEGARDFGEAAADAGVEQIVYLGGLGRDDDVCLRPHRLTRGQTSRSRYLQPISAGRGVPCEGDEADEPRARKPSSRHLVPRYETVVLPVEADSSTACLALILGFFEGYRQFRLSAVYLSPNGVIW